MEANRDEQTLKQILKDFASNTTSHGYSQVKLSTTRLQRWIWIAICAVVNVVGLALFVTLMFKYFQFETREVVSVENKHLKFPSVTICALYPLAGSKLGKYAKPLENKTSFESANLMSSTKAMATLTTFLENLNEKYVQQNKSGHADRFSKHYNRLLSFMFRSENSQIEMAQRSHSYEDLIVSCDFKGEPCKREMFRYEFNNEYFNCYTFNGVGTNVSSKMVWTGSLYGLNIVFYIDVSTLNPNYTIYNPKSPSGGNSGIRVIIHPPHTQPDIINNGINIAPGFSTDIGLNLYRKERLEPPWGECKNGKRIEGFEYEYSVTSCRGQCRQWYLYAKCHCVSAFFLVPKDLVNVQYCGKLNLKNLNSDKANISVITEDLDRLDCERNHIRHHVGSYPKGLRCDCPMPCSHNQYTKQLSYSKWPFKAAINSYYHTQLKYIANYEHLSMYPAIENARNKSDEEFYDVFHQNFLRLNVFYDSLNEYVTKQVKDYELVDFAAEVGGVYGICAGISIVTVCEIIQLILAVVKWHQNQYESRKVNVIEADRNMKMSNTKT
ncbi:unnamed protein product [Owenia fusiformis]|uniref:Uncharacterized protein n=1 Tax=Owenia fusiformis TaxID=6347 RepID=A0A8J1UH01_OWEFU|nr:unnamed protein product [Owenia fusiformis]